MPRVSCTGPVVSSSSFRSALPYSCGYLRSSSQAAADQNCGRESAASRIVMSSFCLYSASAF